jgi:UDP-glucose 4-epimerase
MDAGYQVVIGSSRQDAKLPNELVNCSLVYTNLDDVDTLTDVCRDVDYVIHLATVNAQQSQHDPQLAVKVNGIGTYNLIQASVKNNVKYFLYFSTAHIYGSPLTGKIDENTLPKPSHPYAITHRLAEDFLLESIGNQNIKGSVVRLSNSIGLPLIKEAGCWMLFVNDICQQAIINKCITINTNPYNERDFVSISSVCKVVSDFLIHKPEPEFPVYNIGSGTSKNLLTIAQLVVMRCELLFGFSPNLIYSKGENKFNSSLEYKVDKFVDVMGYTPSCDLTSSIDEVLRFCQSQHSLD